MTGLGKIFRAGATAAAVLTTAVPAQAAQEYSLTIAAVGAQSSTIGYIRFTSGATLDTATCPWGVVYVDLTNEGGKAKLSIALTAKSAERVIRRLDYTNDGTRCWVDLLEI